MRPGPTLDAHHTWSNRPSQSPNPLLGRSSVVTKPRARSCGWRRPRRTAAVRYVVRGAHPAAAGASAGTRCEDRTRRAASARPWLPGAAWATGVRGARLDAPRPPPTCQAVGPEQGAAEGMPTRRPELGRPWREEEGRARTMCVRSTGGAETPQGPGRTSRTAHGPRRPRPPRWRRGRWCLARSRARPRKVGSAGPAYGKVAGAGGLGRLRMAGAAEGRTTPRGVDARGSEPAATASHVPRERGAAVTRAEHRLRRNVEPSRPPSCFLHHADHIIAHVPRDASPNKRREASLRRVAYGS